MSKHTDRLELVPIDKLIPYANNARTHCEQLGRTCNMMELDPKYCDVIIDRWEQFTGQKAMKL